MPKTLIQQVQRHEFGTGFFIMVWMFATGLSVGIEAECRISSVVLAIRPGAKLIQVIARIMANQGVFVIGLGNLLILSFFMAFRSCGFSGSANLIAKSFF